MPKFIVRQESWNKGGHRVYQYTIEADRMLVLEGESRVLSFMTEGQSVAFFDSWEGAWREDVQVNTSVFNKVEQDDQPA